MASKVPALMTPEQRRRLIEAPLGIRTLGGRTWGGITNERQALGATEGASPTHRYTGKYDNDGRVGGFEGE